MRWYASLLTDSNAQFVIKAIQATINERVGKGPIVRPESRIFTGWADLFFRACESAWGLAPTQFVQAFVVDSVVVCDFVHDRDVDLFA